MNRMPLDQLTEVIKDAFNGVAKIAKSFQTFFIETMILYLCIPKRINFTQMSRFGDSCESRFRQNFRKGFDWVGYNSGFTSHMDGHRTALAIDPSFIDKSGKHTPGVGYFWSGCASAARHGLEILDIAVIDADGKVNLVDCIEPGKKTQTRKVFFSTDTEMSAKDIMDFYRTRFQIEFLQRDAKQHTGLTHYHSRPKAFIASFRGVSTKYLNNYLTWNNVMGTARSLAEKASALMDVAVSALFSETSLAIPKRSSLPILVKKQSKTKL